MDFVDVDSEKWKQYADYTRWPLSRIYNLESKRLACYERRVAEIFDHCILVTDAEERIFNTKNPHISKVTVITNGVDLDYFSSKSQSGPSTVDYGPSSNDHQLSTIDHLPIIVFTGAMDYYANIDGVIWFSREIFPLIKKEIPEVQFYIVGSNPSKEILSLSKHNGIKVTGYVPDTREYFRKASVAVVPLRIARGIQNKILEPMAMGIPVVATSEALKGTQATLGDGIRVGDRSEDFAAQVLTLLRDIELRNRCSIEAYRYIENHHRWEDHCARLESLLLRQRVADR
jgi:sugar transferase (PEP-CTERM/EpsH1 system associated)